MSGIYIPGMNMPTSCVDCPIGDSLCCGLMPGVPALWKEYTNAIRTNRRHKDCPLIPVPDHGRLIDVGQFEKGGFYGYGRDGKVYKLLWDTKVFDGAKKFYINPIIPASKEGER